MPSPGMAFYPDVETALAMGANLSTLVRVAEPKRTPKAKVDRKATRKRERAARKRNRR